MKKYVILAILFFIFIFLLLYFYPRKKYEKVYIPPPVKKPQVALIIDDLGCNKKNVEELISLPMVVNGAFLPHNKYIDEISEKIIQKGGDVLLHLPMQPLDKPYNPGYGAIYEWMNEEEIRNIFSKDIKSVKLATGVNNHMGSKITQNEKIMRIILEEVKKRNLFFVDSVTTLKSCAYKVAREMGIPSLKRDIFLDTELSYEHTVKHIEEIVSLAKKKKYVVVIGHPHKFTMEALHKYANYLCSEVEFVSIRKMLEDIGYKFNNKQ
jgi:polysaccharide deacetylase 2 family uncharacterized protein YibQ